MINKEMLAEAKQKCTERAEKLPEVSAILNKAEDVCPVAWAMDVVEAARKEACGKSVMCRDGLWQLELMLKAIMTGEGSDDDIEVVKEILSAMAEVGCPNTQKVAELLLASIDTYAEEWSAHARRHRCAALQCPAYYSVYIDPAVCNGCGDCCKAAPAGAVAGGDGMIHVVKDDSKLKTEAFLGCCPVGAVKKAGAGKPQVPESPIPVGTFAAGGAAGGTRRRRRG